MTEQAIHWRKILRWTFALSACGFIIVSLFLAFCFTVFLLSDEGFGPGLTDFNANLGHGYELRQCSANVVVISNDRSLRNTGIDAKVVSLGFDDRFILAKQQMMDATKRNPLRGQFQYWIIDAPAEKQFGPFTDDQFDAQRIALGVPENVTLWGTGWYRP